MQRLGAGPTRKAPASVQLLKIIHQSLDFSITLTRVIWGATVMGYFFLVRRSEYTAHGRKCADFIIQRRDVQFYNSSGSKCGRFEDIVSVAINFRGSKTDQRGEGTKRSIGRSGTPWLCPVYAAWFLAHHHRSLGLPANTPFCTIAPGAVVQVSHINQVIKDAACKIGDDPTRYGIHSLRNGGGTSLFTAKVDSLAVKQFGRWKSDAFERYTRLDETSTRSLASAMINSRALSGDSMGNLHATP